MCFFLRLDGASTSALVSLPSTVCRAGLALASGLAATVTITHMLKAGDGIVCMDDVYGGEAAPSERADEGERNEDDSKAQA